MRRRPSSIALVTLLLVAALASTALAEEEGVCPVVGTYTVSGTPARDGIEVQCHHSDGTYVTQTDSSLPDGNYRCEVSPGPIEIEFDYCGTGRPIHTAPCPTECDGESCETVTCNFDISHCANPCFTAFLALPPLALRRRRHARAALDGPTAPA